MTKKGISLAMTKKRIYTIKREKNKKRYRGVSGEFTPLTILM